MALIFIVAFLLVITLVSAICILIKKCIKNEKLSIISKLYELIKKKVFWNFFNRYCLEVYLETIIAYTIKLNALKFGEIRQTANSILAILIFAALIAYIFFVMNFLLKKFNARYQVTITSD